MKDGQIMNTRTEGTDLYRIDITPKGTKERIQVFVYAKNRLDASTFLITNRFYGRQHNISICTSNLLK